MKRLLLIGLMLCSAGAFAQQSMTVTTTVATQALSHVNPAALNTKVRVFPKRNIDNGAPFNRISYPRASAPAPSIQATASESTIGNTYYDLQTNNTISNRLTYNADSTISAVWTFSPDATTGYPNRGTGYNYFNGSSWNAMPTTRLETERAGFTNIGVTASNQEAVIAHGIPASGISKGMIYTSRPSKGTGSWGSNDGILGEEPTDTIDLWAKMAVGGTDGKSIHAIWRGGSVNASYYGQTGPIFYSRSQNDGVGWDKLETIIPLIDSTYYLGFSGDSYSIDAKDSVVAIVVSDLGKDVALLKSTDNGTTWTKTIVYPFPIPLFNGATMTTDTNADGIADTLWSGTGDANLVIDNNFEVHVFFTAMRTLCDSPGTAVGEGLSWFPNSAELFYWDESMTDSVRFIAFAPDLNGNGMIDLPANDATDCPNDPFPYGNYGLTRIIEEPSAGVDANNNLYVVYQTVDEKSNAGIVSSFNNKLFKHPYIIKSTDGGITWTNYNAAFDALLATQGPTNGEQLEGVFACMAKRVDNNVRITYQRDYYPGVALATVGTCDYNLNTNNGNGASSSDIIYVSIDTSITVGIHELESNPHGVILSSNFPNPATTFTQFNLTLSTSLNVKIDVEDILGQNVYSENKGRLSTGIHTITLNTSYLSSGVYFYTVTAGNEKVTGKMIVR